MMHIPPSCNIRPGSLLRRRSLWALSCASLAIFACFTGSPAGAIVTRHDVADTAYHADAAQLPALLALYRTPDGHRDCLATLIAARWAITAAHCTEDPVLTAALASGDGHATDIAGLPNRIVRVVRAPKPFLRAPADIALLRLAEPVRHVEPLPLYRRTDEAGREVVLPGWGGTGDGIRGAGAADGLFRIARNRVDAANGERLTWTFTDPRSDAGALPLEGISGPGDSGGPALIENDGRWHIAGISSSQRTHDGPEGRYGVIEVYVRVSAFARWIDEVVAADGR